MSKRKESTKTAVFEQTSDGSSIHTMELFRRLTKHEYHQMKDHLYKLQQQPGEKQWIYQEEKGRHRCIRFREHGIHWIMLEHTVINGFDMYFLRMVINPRKLIDPESSYIGILPPEKSSIENLEAAFKNLLSQTVFEDDINCYDLSRVDLCTNIRCDHGKIFRETVRVLRKLPTPPKYKRKFFEYKSKKGKNDKKRANLYNKHYLRFHCGTHELIIYDKTYQVRDGELVVAHEKLPEGVLRFEVHCERAYIREIEKKSGESDTLGLLWRMVKESEPRIRKHFSRCFPDTEFVQMVELEQRIGGSGFKKENQDTMLALASRLQRTQSVDKALGKLKEEGYDTSEVLDRFARLGVSPVPLWKNFCAKSLPGPVELLKAASEGEVRKVEYVKVKYK